MPYLTIENFSAGMDRRRKRVAGAAGTLWEAKNVHITRGGDVERRKLLVPEYEVAGTFGVATLRSQLYVFGRDDLAAIMPVGVQYQRLVTPGDTSAMTRVLDVKTFDGEFYVIAEFADGNVYHYLDGTRVTDWDAVAATDGSYENLATLMAAKLDVDDEVAATAFGNTATITAETPGTAFTISKSTADAGGGNDQDITLTEVQANVAAVTEVLATADVELSGGVVGDEITTLLVDGVALILASLEWASTNAATAIRLATAISNDFATHGYSAVAINETVTISASPGTGAAPNGYSLDVTAAGALTITAPSSMGGGVTAVTAVAQVYTAEFIGTFNIADTFVITLNGVECWATGRASGMGRSLYVDKNRVWSPVGSLLRYSKLDDASEWVDDDAGFINIASQSDGNEQIVVVARYQDQAAIFGASNITLFQLDQDPDNFAFQNVLENTGTGSAAAVIRYGNNDVFYLDISGIRSLRARDASNAPFVSDVGNAIDTFVQEFTAGLSGVEVTSAIGAIEPRDGRYWLILGDHVFVLSHFPGAKISAWTYYELDELEGEIVQAVAKVRDRLFLRAGDFVYCYGGLAGTTYPGVDEAIAEVGLPFLSGQTPATMKDLTGFDFAGTNTWYCEVAFDPNDATKTISAGRLDRVSFANPNKVSIPGRTSLVAPVFACSDAGAATISMAAIHYEVEEAG